MRRLLCVLLFLFLANSLPFSVSFAASVLKTWTFTGRAFNKNGDLFYVEKHDITYKDKEVIRSLTTYYDPSDRIIGTLSSEYDPDPRLCNYNFRDFRFGYEDGARIEKNQICLFRKRSPKKSREFDCLPKSQNQIVGQGFHHFIVNHLKPLNDGKIFHVMLVLPSRLDEFAFRIRKLKDRNGKLHIRLEIDNWFLRLFAPHVDAVYDKDRGVLLRYDGISNISNLDDDHETVTIYYSY